MAYSSGKLECSTVEMLIASEAIQDKTSVPMYYISRGELVVM